MKQSKCLWFAKKCVAFKIAHRKKTCCKWKLHPPHKHVVHAKQVNNRNWAQVAHASAFFIYFHFTINYCI